jgi:hypothetical protein
LTSALNALFIQYQGRHGVARTLQYFRSTSARSIGLEMCRITPNHSQGVSTRKAHYAAKSKGAHEGANENSMQTAMQCKLRHVLDPAKGRSTGIEQKKRGGRLIHPRPSCTSIIQMPQKANRKNKCTRTYLLGMKKKKSLVAILPPRLGTRSASTTARTNVDALQFKTECHVLVLHRCTVPERNLGWDRWSTTVPWGIVPVAWARAVAVGVVAFTQDVRFWACVVRA